MRADLLRAFAAFAAVVVFGCAVYFFVVRLDEVGSDNIKPGNLAVGVTAGLSPDQRTNTSEGENVDDALSTMSSNAMEMKPERIQSKEQNRAYHSEHTVEPTPQVPETGGAPPLQTDSSSEQEPAPAFREPLVFAEDAPNPGTSPNEVAEINALRQEFIDQIGGYDQDPTDPAYQERWQTAQQFLDERLRSELGEEVFGRLQSESVTGTMSELPQE
jgi:hypothetical protein